MPQIFIPPLGTVIQLEEDWHFKLYDESRNQSVLDAAGLTPPYREDRAVSWRDLSDTQRAAEIDKSDWIYTPHPGMAHRAGDYNYWSGTWEHDFVFREGTELKIDRIYIRQGQDNFDSVSFRTRQWVSALGDPLFRAPRKIKSLRFWAKLPDVNKMIGRVIHD